jgi:dTDP-4-amino-4,6-dideoxygalactose transaminase
MPEAPYGRSNCWLTVILITPEEFGADREAIRLALEKENIESRPIWKPMNMQPVFEITHRAKGMAHSDGKRYKARVVWGRGTQMTEEDLNRVVNVLRCCKS